MVMDFHRRLDGFDLTKRQMQKLLGLFRGQRPPIRAKIAELCKDCQTDEDVKVLIAKGYLECVGDECVEVVQSVNIDEIIELYARLCNDEKIKQICKGNF